MLKKKLEYNFFEKHKLRIDYLEDTKTIGYHKILI